jgi:LysM repeat protein
MLIKRTFIVFLGLVLITASAACVKPASKAPATAATSTPAKGTFPVPGTNDVMGQLESFATQTAMAISGTIVATQEPGQATTEPGGPTAAVPAGATSAPAVAQATTVPPAVVATQVPYATLTPGIPKSYTLQKGEYPYCIARRFNVDPGELLSQNGLGANSIVYAGLALKIPQTGHKFPDGRSLKSHPANYTVDSGDTIYTIACYYGDVDPNEIVLANGLKSPYKLNAGQVLHIP